MDAVTNVPVPVNEPIQGYAPGSPERAALETSIKQLAGERAELTMTIGGQQRMGGGDRLDVVQPHNHQHVLGQLAEATDADVAAAIDAAAQAAPMWRDLSFDDRAAVFLKAADLLAADDGDDDAQFAVDSADGHELLWYATQELRHLAD